MALALALAPKAAVKAGDGGKAEDGHAEVDGEGAAAGVHHEGQLGPKSS
jgi:hypothetical protein